MIPPRPAEAPATGWRVGVTNHPALAPVAG